MKDIIKVYSNNYGITFIWKDVTLENKNKIQIIFRDTGMLVTIKELKTFLMNVEYSINTASICNQCPKQQNCKSILLESVSYNINFAMSYTELKLLKQLIDGCLFNLELNRLLSFNNIKTNNNSIS